MNPGAVPPPMAPPPPPPPPAPAASGGFPWKWVLIGCGTVAFLGLLVCGGCMFWGVSIAKSMPDAVNKGLRAIETDATVFAECGRIEPLGTMDLGQNKMFRQQQNSDQTMSFFVDVVGEKAKGEVELKLSFDMSKFKLSQMILETEDGRKLTLAVPGP